MSASAAVIDRLNALGITLKHYRHGRQRTACPWCNKGSKDTALSVMINGKGACWSCWRCEETGAATEDFGRRLPNCSGAANGGRPDTFEHRRTSRRREASISQTADIERASPVCNGLSETARTLWFSAQPITPTSVAGVYIIGRGGILPPTDGDLRWHPAVKYYVEGKPVHTGPALIGLVTHAETGSPISLHQTWIKPDGSGKADLNPPRKLFAGHSAAGGVIRLWPDDEVTLGIVLGEGIETCLAAARSGLTPVWSTISAGNMAEFPVLPGIDEIIILVDHDKPDRRGRRAGIQAAVALVNRYVAAGFDPDRDVVILLPDGEGLDVADLVRRTAA